MSDYTKLNIEDIDDSAQGFGLGDKLEARFARKALGLEQFGFSFQKLQPNFRLPFGHTHSGQEEVYIVLAGSGRAKVGDDVVELRKWDALKVPPKVKRGFESGNDGLTLLAIGGTPSGDAEIIQKWWAD